MKKFFFVFFLIFSFFSSIAFAHGSHGSVGFENPFFVVVFGGIGLGIYASFAEKNPNGLRFFELAGSFFFRVLPFEHFV